MLNRFLGKRDNLRTQHSAIYRITSACMLSRMQTFDPEILRKLAARYRERAVTEPSKAEPFLEIARDMETHAEQAQELSEALGRAS